MGTESEALYEVLKEPSTMSKICGKKMAAEQYPGGVPDMLHGRTVCAMDFGHEGECGEIVNILATKRPVLLSDFSSYKTVLELAKETALRADPLAVAKAAADALGVRASWVVWFRDGRYSYAFGSTAEEARSNYLKEWAEGIARVAPAGDHPNQLPPQNYVHGFGKQ